MRALAAGLPVKVRNPKSTRPWQHVLDPLSGYLRLAQALTAGENSRYESNPYCTAFNFGPLLDSNRTVLNLVEASLELWPGEWEDQSELSAPHEAGRLHLQIDKAQQMLGWKPQWSFAMAIAQTVTWYREVNEGKDITQCCLEDLQLYENNFKLIE